MKRLALIAVLATTATSAHAEPVTPKFIASIRAKLDESLFDYTTARFRDVKISETLHICGFVNAKNRNGAFVGWRSFIGGKLNATDNYVIVASDDMTDQVFTDQCSKPDEKWHSADYSKALTYSPK